MPLCQAVKAQENATNTLHFQYFASLKTKDVLTIAKAQVYLMALQKAHATLLTHKALRFGIKEPLRQQALVSALSKPIFTEKKLNTPEASSITVILVPHSKGVVEKEISIYLKQESLLDLRQEWLHLFQKNTQEATKLLTILSTQRPHSKDKEVTTSAPFHGEVRHKVKAEHITEHIQTKLHPIVKRLEALFSLHTALHFFQERWQEPHKALTFLQDAVQKDAHMTMAWACLAEVYLQLDHMNEALHSVNTTLTLENNRARTLYIRGLIHLRLHQPSTAILDFNTALALQPHNASWLRARGAAHMVLENEQAMCNDFAKACTLGDCQGLIISREKGQCLRPQ